MNVLIVTPFYLPDVGGSSRLLSDIADHLHEGGHNVDVLTYGKSMWSADARRYRDFDAGRPYRIYRVPARRFPGASSISMFGKLVELSLRNRYDVVLCGVGYPSAVLAEANRILTGTPFAVYSHGEDVTCARRSRRVRISLERSMVNALLVMTNSRFTSREIVGLGVPSDRVVCCPPWIDPQPYEQVDEREVARLRRGFGLDGKRVIFTLARLVDRKGHDMVIRSLKDVVRRVPDAHYLVVGKGDRGRLRALAREEGVDAYLTIVDEIAEEDLAPAFRMADVTIMVSRWDEALQEVEGFGIVYLEAAACGRPSIAGNAGGSPDAVVHGVTGYTVDPLSTAQIAESLITLLTDADTARAMGEAGRDRVRRYYRKESMLRRVEGLLQSVIIPEPEEAVLARAVEISPLQ